MVATSRAKAISWVASTIVVPSRGQPPHDVEHLADELGVEGRGDLVEQQQGRVGGQRPRPARPAAAGRRRAGRGARRPCRPGRTAPAARAPCASAVAASTPCTLRGARVQVVEHGQVREQVVGLEDHARSGAHRARVDPRVGDLARPRSRSRRRRCPRAGRGSAAAWTCPSPTTRSGRPRRAARRSGRRRAARPCRRRPCAGPRCDLEQRLAHRAPARSRAHHPATQPVGEPRQRDRQRDEEARRPRRAACS